MSRFVSTLVSLAKIACVLGFFGVLFVVSGYLAVQWALSAEEFQVPNVVGLPLSEAQALLVEGGLIVEVEEHPLTDDEVPAGHVLSQNPLAGTAIKRQRGIRLTLSAGIPPRALPMIVGDPLPRAQIALEQQDVDVEYVARVYSRELDAGRVLAQQPGTSELPSGETVPARLLVSRGAPPTTYVMPDLAYRSVAEIEPLLEALGFRVQRRPSPSRVQGQPAGTIITHEPSPGFPVRVGELIALQVNR